MLVESDRTLSRRKLASIRRRFECINRKRLMRLEESLAPPQRLFVRLLPLVFHTNYPLMPGFVSGDTPQGLSTYEPDKESLRTASQLAKSFKYRRNSYRRRDLDALYLMGSAGTLGYSEKSDFDVWLCHSPSLAKGDLVRLQDKAGGVTDWATSLGLQVHFFISTADDVRAGRQASLSSESSGSAQHHLLLDEFYRTALLLAGRHPLWWLVPPEEDHRYDEHVGKLIRRRLVNPDEVVDFGGLSDIPASEFFGATLWHLYKGISAPHKSLLKVLLLESYASEFPDIELLSRLYKRAVYAGESRLERLDPYRLMLEKVESYLSLCQDKERLELARRSFYIKTGQRLSRDADPDPRHVVWNDLKLIVQRWRWNNAHLEDLDSHSHWKVEQVVAERRLLVNALTRGYRFLSRFAREQKGLAAISQEDMNVLGRRLFAAFERKAGKIELIRTGSAQNLHEPYLTVRRQVRNTQESWLLFRPVEPNAQEKPSLGGPVEEDSTSLTLLKRGRTLVELLAWCHFNGVADGETRFSLVQSGGEPSPAEVNAVLRALQECFPLEQAPVPSVQSFSQASRLVKACVFVNVGVDPLPGLAGSGNQLTSDHSDPLNFAGHQENLARTIDYVFVTNWEEVFVFRYEETEGLIACLGEHAHASSGDSPAVSTYCFSPGRGHLIANRLDTVFRDVAAAFARGDHRSSTRYILKADGKYFAIYLTDGASSHIQLGGEPGMMRYLGQPNHPFSPTVFDGGSPVPTPLSDIYRRSNAGTIQVFLQSRGRQASIHVIDEKGSLFQDFLSFQSQTALLNQYERFLTAVVYRHNAAPADEEDSMRFAPVVEFYKLTKNSNGRLQSVSLEPGVSGETRAFLQLQVISELVGSEVEFTVYCDGTEFSTLEFGKGLFSRVAEHVRDLRSGRSAHPIYITDIDLSGMIAAGQASIRPQTVHYLHYKKSLESRLNEALSQLRVA